MQRLQSLAFAAVLTASPLAAQSSAQTSVSRGMEIQVRLPGDSVWHTAKVGSIGNADRSCLMVQLVRADQTTGDFYLRRFAGTVAVRTKDVQGEWHDIPDAEFESLQACTLE